MHPRALAQRQAAAHERLMRAQEQLAARTGLSDAPLVATGPAARDPQLARLAETEALVAFLESLVARLPAMTPADAKGIAAEMTVDEVERAVAAVPAEAIAPEGDDGRA